MSKDTPPKNPAMYLAFQKACAVKREKILSEDYMIGIETDFVINRLQKAPFVGKIPVEKIQAAVNSVSKKK